MSLLKRAALKPSEKTSLLGFFLQRSGEYSLASFSRIVESRAFPVAFRGSEEQSLLGFVGKSCEPRFAVGVGSDLKIQSVGIEESVCDVDFDAGSIDRSARCVGDGEIRRA